MNAPSESAISSRDQADTTRDVLAAETEPVIEPDRNFRGIRMAFLTLLIAAMVLPLMYVGVAAVIDLNQRREEARATTSRVARIAEEHAIKVFDLNESLDERILDLLGDTSDASITRQGRALQQRLAKLGGGYPQVAAIGVLNGTGRMLVNSAGYPPATGDFRDRLDYSAIDQAATLWVSPTMVGAMTGKPIFSTSSARRDANGKLTGVVAVSLKAEYFSDFYKDLVGTDQSMTVGLARIDGVVLVRYPSGLPAGAPRDGSGVGHLNRPFHALSALLRGLGADENGHSSYDDNDSTTSGEVTLSADGDQSVISYRRVAGYPVYVFSSYPTSALISAWLSHVGLLAAGVFVPCLVLWTVILIALLRLRTEERAWLSWRSESVTRRSVEAAFRQARRTEALGNLVGSVAHDFNNLLMTMSSNAQVLRRRGVPPPSAPDDTRAGESSPELAAIERAIRNGKQLTRQLLGVARKQPQRIETLVLQTWLAHATPLLNGALHAEVRLVLQIAPDVWPIDVDAGELELALLNVTANARDAMAYPAGGTPRPGSTMTIEVENMRFSTSQSYGHAGDYVRISVADTGVGMPADVLRRAFEPLYTTKPQGMGTGLGLPQVASFCEQAGGTATIESEIGRGTIVRFYLPRSQARAPSAAPHQTQAVFDVAAESGAPAADTPAPMRAPVAPTVHESVDRTPSTAASGVASRRAMAAPASSAVSSTSGATTGEERGIAILLVEDNPEVAAGTEALLDVMGHRVQWVDNADTALTLLMAVRDSAADGFDMVLSDIHMPGTMNGIDLALTLRDVLPVLPIVLVTGYASEIERAKQAEIPVLAKPFDVEVLESLIQDVAERPLAGLRA